MVKWWILLIVGIAALLIGAVAGFFIAIQYFKRYQKKNPPINEEQIRIMMKQMGRTPSEKQVRQVMAAMQNAKQ